jgi:hypothetical protein
MREKIRHPGIRENNGKHAGASLQIDATNATLAELIRIGQASPQPVDMKKSFEAYSNNVNKMDGTARTVSKHIDQMTAHGNDYFEEWSKTGGTYTNPEVQRLSAQERQERVRLSRSFSEITASSAGMRGALNAYLAEIKQIQTYLSNNLTAAGIAAIAPIAQAAARDGAALQQSFQPAQTAIERARLEMMPGGAAAGGPQQPFPYQQPQDQQLQRQNELLQEQNQQLQQQNQPLYQQDF